jgi:hypothetical protein
LIFDNFEELLEKQSPGDLKQVKGEISLFNAPLAAQDGN